MSINFSFTNVSPAALTQPTVLIGAQKTADGPRFLLPESDAVAGFTDFVRDFSGFGANLGDFVILPAPEQWQCAAVACVGLGSADPTRATLFEAAGQAGRQLAGHTELGVALPVSEAAELQAVLRGLALGNYAYTRYVPATKSPIGMVEVAIPASLADSATASGAEAVNLATAVALTRDLINTAPNHLYPQSFVQAAENATTGLEISIQQWDEAGLEELGCGGILSVGQGSARPPRLLKLSYCGPEAKQHLALVGKGITFDSGGLSLKPPKSMETMRADMSGAAAVLGTITAIAAAQLPVKVTAWMALAENMPGGKATRPSDVVTMVNGKTVEVLNTDAEGRMVLGDALALASGEEPDLLVDIATLTGAKIVALGNRYGAVMGSDSARKAVLSAAENSLELFWPLPLPEYLAADLKSKTADYANIGRGEAGALFAGLFLREFVGDTTWAHLDIAGAAFNEGKEHGYICAGATGLGVMTLFELAKQLSV